MHSPFPRTLALVFSLFLLGNLALRLIVPRLDSTIWVIDLHLLPKAAAYLLIAGAGVMLGAYAVVPALGRRRRAATLLMVGALALIALINAAQVQVLTQSGRIAGMAPLSVSAITALLLTIILIAAARGPAKASVLRSAFSIAAAGACIVSFPLAQIAIFGKTDYRRHADAVVVFGARVYTDGRPSDALADRMRTACELVVQGYAPLLIVSGGPGDGETHETTTMRAMALAQGIAPDAIIVDTRGINTRATINNLAHFAHEKRLERILAVSHFYHLPRIKLTAQRCQLEVYTVPARESYTLSRMPWFIMREVAACWAYYLCPAQFDAAGRPG